MIRACLTSPTDQAFGSIDIAMQFKGEHTDGELALIGEATRLIMVAALDSPNANEVQWTTGIHTYLGSPACVSETRLQKKAGYARFLLDNDLLISDEVLVGMIINNGLAKPVKGC